MFTGPNLKILALSLGALVIGYVLLGQGPVENPLSVSVGPVVLVLTYLVLVPVAILYEGKKKEDKKDAQS